MRVTISILFLFTYLLGQLAPFAPIVEYYANYTYIKTNLCEKKDEPESDCCGKCYLKKQIVTEEKKEEKQLPAVLKEGKQTDFHFSQLLTLAHLLSSALSSTLAITDSKILPVALQPDTPPPRFYS